MSGCVGRPMPTRSRGIACGRARGAQGALMRSVGGPAPAHPTQCRTHVRVEAANTGTDSTVAPSRDTRGAVSASLGQHPSPHPLPRLGSAPLSHSSWEASFPIPTLTSSGPHLALPPNFRASFPSGLWSSSCTRQTSSAVSPNSSACTGKRWPRLPLICPGGLSRLKAPMRRGRN